MTIPSSTSSQASPGSQVDPLHYELFGIDETVIAAVMATAMERGADYADLFFQQSRGSSISMEDGIISRASSSVDRGVGIRVLVGDQTGYAYSEDLDQTAMCQAARTAASIASGGGGVPPQSFKHCQGENLYAISERWDTVEVARKLPIIQDLDKRTRAKDSAVTKVSIHWGDGESRVLVVNSLGEAHADYRPSSSLGLSVTLEKNGETQSGYESRAGRYGISHYTSELLDGLVEDVVDKTLILFEARRPPAGEMPVVLAAGAAGILLHEAIGHGLEADCNRKGASVFSTMMNETVAEDCVTIVDSALHPEARGAINFDDEGSDVEKTTLVEKGTLRSYLHDRLSAKHYGLDRSTGSGRRQSFRYPPLPRMRCTYMENGPHTHDEIISSVKKGILAQTFTNGQVAIGAGDFTFYVKNGWLIEDGKITAPIKDVNIIGNGPEALRRIEMVANDLAIDSGGWTCGKDGQSVPVSQGLPTTLVSHLTVGGEDA
ncbi:MAG: TldD protein [Planctomycetota bacterium]|jgi:TldD protein